MNADEHVAAQGQFALEGRGAVGDDVALLHLVADLDDRLLVLAGPLVEAHELPQLVHFGADLDAVGVDVGDRALVAGPHEHAGVAGPRRAPGPCRRSAARPTSSGTACRCMLEPISARLASSCSRNGISPADTPTIWLGATSMYWILLGRHEHEVAPVPGHDRVALNLVVLHRHVGRGDVRFRLLVGPQPHDFVGQLAVLHLAVRRDQEAVVVHRRRTSPGWRSGRCSCLPASRSGRCGRSARCARRGLRSRPACGSGRPGRGPTAAARA